MKKLLICLVTILSSFSAYAQENITLPLTDPSQIWTVVKLALQERSVSVSTLNAQTGMLKTDYFEYTAMLIKNRARYQIKLVNSTLNLELIDREYLSQAGWAKALIPLSKSSNEKYLGTLSKRIFELSKIQPVAATPQKSAGFQNEVTIKGLTMSIESTRVIGNKVLLTGKFVSDREIQLKNLNPIKAITSNGTELTTSQGTWAGEDTYQLYAAQQLLQSDIPVSFNIMFDSKGEKINLIKMLSIKLYNPENTTFVFNDIQIPMKTDPNLSSGSIEIYKDVYMTMKKQDDTAGHLKIYFVVENKSGRDRALFLEKGNLIDASGNAYPNPEFFIGGEKLYSNVMISPDTPVAGYFDFTGISRSIQ